MIQNSRFAGTVPFPITLPPSHNRKNNPPFFDGPIFLVLFIKKKKKNLHLVLCRNIICVLSSVFDVLLNAPESADKRVLIFLINTRHNNCCFPTQCGSTYLSLYKLYSIHISETDSMASSFLTLHSPLFPAKPQVTF